MYSVNKCTNNLFKIYFTLTALHLYNEISRDFVSGPGYVNNIVQDAAKFTDDAYSQVNKEIFATNNDRDFDPIAKFWRSRKIWKNLIDDWVIFNHDRHDRIVTLYPLDIKKEFPKVDSGCTSATSMWPDNEHHGFRNDIWTLDWNHNADDYFGTDKTSADLETRSNYLKNELLDNSFYDLHLNTTLNTSAEAEKKDTSPLKSDTFLQSLSDCHQEWDNETLMDSTAGAIGQDAELDEMLSKQGIDLGYGLSPGEFYDGSMLSKLTDLDDTIDYKAVNPNEITLKDEASNDQWAGIPFKIDNETGEYIRLPLDDLFEDILPATENNSDDLNTQTYKEEIDEDSQSSKLFDLSTDELSLIMQSFWPPSQDKKPSASICQDNACRQGICNPDPEVKPADLPYHVKLDSRIQDFANLFTPVPGFYGMNPDISPYAHYHAHYPPKNNPNLLPHGALQHSFHSTHKDDICVQTHFAHNLESAGSLGPLYSNDDIHCIKNFTNSSADMVHTEGFLSTFLSEDCIQIMDVNGSERPPTCEQDSIIPLNNSSAALPQRSEKPLETENSLCTNNITERLDLSCDSAVSSLGSERVPSASDGEWGEGSDSGQDYHQTNYYGPCDYSASSRNFSARQMPIAQKKYHLFGKRYFQEQAPENSAIQSSTHYLHANAPGVECNGMENIIDNSTYDDCSDEMLPIPNEKANGKLNYTTVKSDRDKLKNGAIRSQIDHDTFIRHNHTYTMLQNSTSNPRYERNCSESKDSSHEGYLTRDEKRARSLNLPISVSDIINLPMDEFNERISKYDLNENQLSLIRDIRRRGKNKVAAQNCRKRKLDQILSLEGEVKEVRRRKEKLHADRAYIAAEKKRIANKFAVLHQHIFQFLRDAEGNPCSPSKYSLQQASDGSIYLLPRDSSKMVSNCHMSFLIGSNESSINDASCKGHMQQSYVRTLSESSPSTAAQSQIHIDHGND